MNIQILQERLGLQLTKYEDPHPAHCVRFDYAGHYAEDENGEVVALNLRGKILSEDPGAYLAELPALRYLNLSETGIKRLSLPELAELLVLNVSDNPELTELQLPSAFPKLLRVDVSRCALKELQWPTCPSLEWLDASWQKGKALTKWYFRDACKCLYFFDLSHNGLSRLELPAGFDELGILCLEENKLYELELTGVLPKLESLRLNDNALRTVPFHWPALLPALQNLYLANNRLSSDFQTFLDNEDQHSVIAKLWGILADRRRGAEQDKECKILLLGNGGVGKSNILNRLTGKPFNPKWDSTEGVRIEQKELGGYKVQYWDFGGQDIYHATHRLFMHLSAVYLVAWDPVTEEAQYSELPEQGETRRYENYRLPYWLDYVRPDSAVIVVQTKKDEAGIKEKPGLRTRYEKTFIYFDPDKRVASNQPDDLESGYEDLERSIQLALRKAQPEERIAESWLTIRDRLRARKEKSITVDTYRREIVTADLELQTDPLELLSRWLHETGVVFYKKGLFKNQIILDQEWATQAVYTLFNRAEEGHYHEIVKNRGKFTGEVLERYWKEHSSAERELFVDFMLSCEICFEREDEHRKDQATSFRDRVFYAPQMMPEMPHRLVEKTNKMAGKSSGWWYLRYYHEWLHKGIMRRFIVQTHTLAAVEDIWRNGILLGEGEDVLALVESDDTTISVKVTQNGKSLLDKIRNLLDELQREDEPGIIYVSDDGKNEVALSDLSRFASDTAKIISVQGEEVALERFRPFLERDYQQSFSEVDPTNKVSPAIEKEPDALFQVKEQREKIGKGKYEVTVTTYGKKLLMLAATPIDTELLRFDAEFAQVDSMRRKGTKITDVLQEAYVTRPRFFQSAHDLRPQLLHFTGHGQLDEQSELVRELGLSSVDQTGILICGEDNEKELMSIEMLVRLVQSVFMQNNSLELIVFNACYTSRLAQEVSQIGIPAIGVSGRIADKAAISFSGMLYSYISRANALLEAFMLARNYAFIDHDSAKLYRLFIDGNEQVVS